MCIHELGNILSACFFSGRSHIMKGIMKLAGGSQFPSSSSRNCGTFSTEVEDSTPHPVWRMKHVFAVEREDFYACKLEVSVWSYSHSSKHDCLGKRASAGKAGTTENNVLSTSSG